MVPRKPLGKAISSQTLPEKHFTRIFDFPGKVLGPLVPLGIRGRWALWAQAVPELDPLGPCCSLELLVILNVVRFDALTQPRAAGAKVIIGTKVWL